MAKIYRFAPEAAVALAMAKARQVGLPVDNQMVQQGLNAVVRGWYQDGLCVTVDEGSPYYQNLRTQFGGREQNLRQQQQQAPQAPVPVQVPVQQWPVAGPVPMPGGMPMPVQGGPVQDGPVHGGPGSWNGVPGGGAMSMPMPPHVPVPGAGNGGSGGMLTLPPRPVPIHAPPMLGPGPSVIDVAPQGPLPPTIR